MIMKKFTKNKGFTLVEMLVAVFIFSLALTALIKVSARGLRSARNAESQITAEFLSLEGLERIRAYRDTQFLENPNLDNWNEILNPACQPSAVSDDSTIIRSVACEFTTEDLANINNTIKPCTDDCLLKQRVDNGAYLYTSTQPTTDSLFTREMFFIYPNLGSPNELMVESRVSWPSGSVSYYDSLFLWNN